MKLFSNSDSEGKNYSEVEFLINLIIKIIISLDAVR